MSAAQLVPMGRAVAAGRGWFWIQEGWRLFTRQPVMWIAIAAALFIVFFGLALIRPLAFFVSIASTVLYPVVCAGLIAGARAIDEGRRLEFAHLFAGFRERFPVLAAVGLVYLAAEIIVAVIAAGLTGESFQMLLPQGAARSAEDPQAAITLLLALLVTAALLLPLVMAVWFAPALVLFHGENALGAMKSSFVACVRNVVPFLVYGAIALVLCIIAALPAGLGLFVVGPVLAASLYTSYRDIFFEERPAAP